MKIDFSEQQHSVILVEDDLQYRANLKFLLEQSSQFICKGEFIQVKEALDHLSYEETELVLLDIGLPDMSGLEAIEKILTIQPDVKIVILTIFDDEDKIFRALHSGAFGYFLKWENENLILNRLNEVLVGGAVFSPSIAAKVLKFFKKKPFSKFRLTRAEKEILILLKQGLTMKEIAEQTCRSYGTVDSHLKNIYRKLHVNSGIQAVVLAMEEGLI